MIACLFIGNMFKLKTEVLGFSQQDGIKGYTFIFSGLRIVFLSFPIIFTVFRFYSRVSTLKTIGSHCITCSTSSIIDCNESKYFFSFLGSKVDYLDEYMSIKAGFGFSGLIYLLVAGLSTYSSYKHHVLQKIL